MGGEAGGVGHRGDGGGEERGVEVGTSGRVDIPPGGSRDYVRNGG